jgi:hypothetical protein
MITDAMEDVADERDTRAVDRLDKEFKTQRENEHAALMAAEATKTEAERAAAQAKADVERSAARAVLVKHAGVASLLLGAGIAIACFGASFLLPGHEGIVTRDVPGPERVVTKEVVKEAPGPERLVYVTKEEKKFIDSPDYQTTDTHGKIVADPEGHIKFDNGKYFVAALGYDSGIEDTGAEYDTGPYVGDYGYCNKIAGMQHSYHCMASHNGVDVDLGATRKQRAKTSPSVAETAPPPVPYCAEKTDSGMPILVPNCKPKTGLGGML